jgi:hypothetical protein
MYKEIAVTLWTLIIVAVLAFGVMALIASH